MESSGAGWSRVKGVGEGRVAKRSGRGREEC